jgi:hypothetical protein
MNFDSPNLNALVPTSSSTPLGLPPGSNACFPCGILKAAREKPIAELDDQTLILADQAEKAQAQMEREVRELLNDKYPADKTAALSKLLTGGTWTHDYPITCDRAHELGLRVRSDMPESFMHLMQLYPQPASRQPSVEYTPLRRVREPSLPRQNIGV